MFHLLYTDTQFLLPLLVSGTVLFILLIAIRHFKKIILENHFTLKNHINETASKYHLELTQVLNQFNHQLSTFQLTQHNTLQEMIARQMNDIREQLRLSFSDNNEHTARYFKTLTDEIKHHLHQLTHQVNHRLSEGFDKTSTTFMDILKRLNIIDEAQKRISELSSHVINLKDILQDKRSRGAFGEIQLEQLIANMIPPQHYAMQATLSNQKRADCILYLPDPTGNIVIDAKFPLENYQKMIQLPHESSDRKRFFMLFKQDLQKHIKDIAEKYIIPNETADSALMFIPAEAIFAEIHAALPDIVTLSQKQRVWIVSPTTLMAVLTTARAVLKDDATRKQVHIIQQHLNALANDFQRFEKRMDKLSKHIDQAQQDVTEVNTSAKKIAQRFHKIESVDLENTLLPVNLTKEPIEELSEEC
jgi:DNA recombination protein RmuC